MKLKEYLIYTYVNTKPAHALFLILNSKLNIYVIQNKNERTNTENSRNGYYPERTISTGKWEIFLSKFLEIEMDK